MFVKWHFTTVGSIKIIEHGQKPVVDALNSSIITPFHLNTNAVVILHGRRPKGETDNPHFMPVCT